MSPSIPDTHAEAWALLPWLASGRIAPGDREWVEAHVQGCALCRAELEAQRSLCASLQSAGSAAAAGSGDEQRSFDKLWARIEASQAASPRGTGTQGPAGRASSRTVRWLAAAVIVQGFGLALFGLHALRGPAAEFSTVSRVDVARTTAPEVRIVFNTLLSHQGLSIVSGPGTSGNFTAALSADAVASGATAESVASVISKDPNVSFAQPVAR
jgi:hypothetical protein